MHSIKDLEDRFGLSYWQARKRLSLIRENFDGEVRGGQNSKYWLTDDGLAILDRILELEGQSHDLTAAVRQVKDEVEVSDDTRAESKTKGDKVDQKYVQRLEGEVEFLREELKRRNRQIQQQLPAAPEEKDDLYELSLFQVIKKWLASEV